ncbi:MAG: L,D-transpeptidase family protein [Gammaproteobacteria bacterium]
MQPRSRIEISLATQLLRLLDGDGAIREYRVSTARNGAGEQSNSECTPRGRHVIAAKIGAGAPLNSVFVGRVATGEIYSKAFAATQPRGRDWILTRILWLSGCVPGRNQGGDCDTYARYIYLHGTPAETALGMQGSRGCVRMGNSDVIDLFERVGVGCIVDIEE